MESISFLQILVCVAVVSVVTLVFGTKRTKRRANLPPGPRPWPVIGNLHLLLGGSPHKSMTSLSKKYGPLMSLKLGSVQAIVVSNAEMAKEILKTQDHIFASRPVSSHTEILHDNSQNLAFSPLGPAWKLMRKVCSMELFTVKRLKQFQKRREVELMATIQSMLDEGRDGKVVQMSEQITSLTWNTLTTMLFNSRRYVASKTKTSSSPPDHDVEMVGKFKECIKEVFRIAGAFIVGDYIPWLQVLDIGGYRGELRAMKVKLDAFLDTVIEEHRRKRFGRQSSETEDFVDVLLSLQDDAGDKQSALTDVQIKQLMMDMIVAGTDTTSVMLVWMLTALMMHPHVYKKVQDELTEVVGDNRLVEESDLPQLKYLHCVLGETFRVHPPGGFLLPHESIADTQVDGYDIPQKTRVFINMDAMSTDPVAWPNPHIFDPDRHINSPFDIKGAHYNALAFGSGRRMCPGINLALIVVELTMAQMIQTCNFSLPHGVSPADVDTRHSTGMVFSKTAPLELLVSPRKPTLVSYST